MKTTLVVTIIIQYWTHYPNMPNVQFNTDAS